MNLRLPSRFIAPTSNTQEGRTIMQKFEKGFFIGAATAAHQVEGNNTNSDYWAQEQLPHSSFTEPSGIAVLDSIE